MPSGNGHKLWTPEGVVAEKDVIPISRRDVLILANLHELAQKYGFVLVCKACDNSILGRNSGHEQSGEDVTVSCACREFRYRV